MKPACALLFFLLTVVSVTAQSYEPTRSGNLYGFSNNGRMLIPTTFQYATHFRDGLALVKQNGKWGYIDSTGAWIVPPKFDNAEPFIGKSAFVYLKGKTGVIDNEGKYLAEPVYDSLELTFYGILIKQNGRRGLISEKYGNVPVAYTDFDFNYSNENTFLFAQRGKNDFDLYLNGKLLLKGLDRGLYYGDFLQDFELLKVSYGHKLGMLRLDGTWAVEPGYDKIDYIVVQGADPLDSNVKGIGRLLKMEKRITPDDIDASPVYYLARMDGTLISDLPFERAELITYDYWEDRQDEIELRQDGRIVYLKPDMTIERSPYVTVYEHLGWKVCDDGAKTHLFDSEGREVLTYDEIILPESAGYNYDAPYLYTPYVHVGEQRGDALYWAIYHLVERRFITEWMPEEIGVTITEMNDQQQLFSFYAAQNGYYSWYDDETGIIIPFAYSDFRVLNGSVFAARPRDAEAIDVYGASPHTIPKKLLSAPVAGVGNELMSASYYVDDETGEINTVYDFPFTWSFVYYRNAEGKYGLIADDHTIVPASYDSLAPNEGTVIVVLVAKNGKWAAVDTRNGDRFEPVFDTPQSFNYEGSGIICTVLPDESCYMNIRGKKFWTLSNEYYIFKEGGKVGLKVYPDFPRDNDDYELRVTVPAVYKSIALNNDGYPNRFIAKGTNGKYGVIDGFNDTIIPFLYSEIKDDYDNPYDDGDGFYNYYVNTVNGKKKGLANLANGAQLPAQFDNLRNLENAYGLSFGFRTESDGKFGLYSDELKEMLPCVYDALYISNFHGDNNEIYLRKNGKWQVVNAQRAKELDPLQLAKLPQFDLIMDSSGYVKTASGYDRYDAFSGRLLTSGLPQPDFSVWPSDYTFFLKDGLIGVKDAQGKVVLKPQLTAVSWIDDATITGAPEGELYFYLLSLNKRYTADQW